MIEIPYKKLLSIQVVLTNDSRNDLLNTFPPVHSNVYAHHMTIKFRPSEDLACDLAVLCGKNVIFETIYELSDDKGQAVAVTDGENLSTNEIPHITISCNDGISPVYSNDLLSHQSTLERKRFEKIKLNGIVTFITKNQQYHQEPIVIV